MIDLTFEQISAAKNKELDAITAVIEATEERVLQLARRFASVGGMLDNDTAEDLAQIGRIGVWQAIERFNGSTVAEFFTFIDNTVKGLMSNERKSERRQGVSREVASVFESALTMADGDAYLAEKIAQDADAMTAKRRLSPQMAYAARLSYQGMLSLDQPARGSVEDDHSFADSLGAILAEQVGVPADLLEPSDFVRARREKTKVRVHSILNGMGRQAQITLKAMAGIDPVGYYGDGDTDPFRDDELADDFGIARKNVKAVRSKAKGEFARRYEAAYPF